MVQQIEVSLQLPVKQNTKCSYGKMDFPYGKGPPQTRCENEGESNHGQRPPLLAWPAAVAVAERGRGQGRRVLAGGGSGGGGQWRRRQSFLLPLLRSLTYAHP